jgi:hypothetical protein
MTWVCKFKAGRFNRDESGYVLMMSLFVILILFLLGTTLAIMGIQEFTLSARTKVMDQAYAIADAGVNRAAVALQMKADPDFATTSPTYDPANPDGTAQSGPNLENFGGGQFTWWVFQSDTVPTNSAYKIIRSKGTMSRSGRTAERTIETRIIMGAGGGEYDASFDYLFYNGNRDNLTSPPDWPTTRLFGAVAIAGNYTWDGATPYQNATPRGAVYVKGGINAITGFMGDLNIMGNVVATNDITLGNCYGLGWSDPGLVLKGKAIAGIDGSGNATIKTGPNVGVTNTGIRISNNLNGPAVAGTGFGVMAAGDVTIQTNTNLSFGTPLVVDNIKAGGNVTISGSVNISKDIMIGDIVSGLKTGILSRWLTGISVGSIYAGQGTDNLGVNLDTVAASQINTSNIYSHGRVNATARVAGINVGSVTAGNDRPGEGVGGTGVAWDIRYLSQGAIGNITSAGEVDLYANGVSGITCKSITAGTSDGSGTGGTGVWFHGATLASISSQVAGVYYDTSSIGDVIATMSAGSNINIGGVWSGRNVDLQGGEWVGFNDSIRTGPIQAKGFASVVTGDDITVAGSITAEQWVKAVSIGKYLNGSGDNSINIGGNISAGGTAVPSAGGYDWNNPANPGETCSIFVNNSNDFPGFPDNVTVSGQVSSPGGIVIYGNDTVQIGNVYAGNNSYPNSNVRISWSLPFWGSSNCYYIGNIFASGFVDIYTDAEFTGVDDSINTNEVRAGGYVRMYGHDEIRVNGNLWANGNVDLRSEWKDITTGNEVDVWGYIKSRGSVYYHGISVGNDCRINNGVWANSVEIHHDQTTSGDFNIFNGVDGSADAIRAVGWVNLDASTDVWPADADILLHGKNVYCGSYSESGSVDYQGGGRGGSYGSLPAAYTNPGIAAPSVATPAPIGKPYAVFVDRNGTLEQGGVGQAMRNVDMLSEAGLHGTVDILEPDWAYFEGMAEKDDAENPSAFHMIYNGGAGDDDHNAMNSSIDFVFDTSSTYSDRETIYNGDPDVTLNIKVLDWLGRGANFTATIVSRGDVVITANNQQLFMDTANQLNIVAGHDISALTAGLTLWETADCQYHFWAYHNIDMGNMRFSLGGNQIYYGSFTAGNRVHLADNSFWPNSTFRWSRWALDPWAWAPPFKVLTWKEL